MCSTSALSKQEDARAMQLFTNWQIRYKVSSQTRDDSSALVPTPQRFAFSCPEPVTIRLLSPRTRNGLSALGPNSRPFDCCIALAVQN